MTASDNSSKPSSVPPSTFWWPAHSNLCDVTKSAFLPLPYLAAWRLVCALYSTSLWLYMWIGTSNWSYTWYMFLTNWGMLSVVFYFWTCTLCCFWVLRRDRKNFSSVSSHSHVPARLWQPAHILFEVAWSLQCVIAFLYWSAEHQKGDIKLPFILDFQNHGMLAILVLIDMVINQIRFIPAHCLINVSIGVVYAFVNLTYCKATGRYLYAILTWENIPASFGMCAVGFLFVCFFFFLGFAFDKYVKRKVTFFRIVDKWQPLLLSA
eukprot:GILI01021274.1.p1 GENE.GILI01021274.1~~GILI01021274.1.p1  ORF type:complete len:265 (+),score=68.42 GILI01021274.1:131-925(+)